MDYPNVPRQLLESSKVLGEAQYSLKSDNRHIFFLRAENVPWQLLESSYLLTEAQY